MRGPRRPCTVNPERRRNPYQGKEKRDRYVQGEPDTILYLDPGNPLNPTQNSS